MAWVSSQPGESVPGEGRVEEHALEVHFELSSDLDLRFGKLGELGLSPRGFLASKEPFGVSPSTALLRDGERTKFSENVVAHASAPQSA